MTDKRREIIDIQGSVSVYEAEDKLLRSRSGGVATPGDIPVAASTVSSETSYGITPSAGAAATFSRGDHTHGSPAAPVIPAAADSVASETSYGITPAVGVATTYARGDHTHGSPAAPTIPSAADTVVTETGYAQSSTAGTAATFSRSDHTHGTPIIVSDTYHGIAACGALSLSGSTVTLAGAVTYWYQGSKYTTASDITCDLNSDTVKDTGSGTKLQSNQIYYVYFKDATGTLYWSTVAWSLTTKVSVCSVYWNGSAGAICRETHNHTRDLDWHTNAHLTIGARYYSGLDLVKPTTSVDSSLELTEGVVYDEDIANTVTNALSKISRIWYLTSGKYTWVDSTLPYAGTTGDPKYANGTTLVSVTDSRFVAMWVYASPDVNRPIYIFPGTTEETTIAAARALTPPVLAGYGLTPELKLIYRFIFRGDGEFQESADYRTASSLPSGFISATTASSVSVVPHGDIASTNVQSALEELDTEKAAVGQTMYIGTTSTAINRASAAQALTGITSVTGSASASGTLTLQSTSDATKGKIIFGTSAYDEVNNRLGIANASPSYPLDVTGNARITGGIGLSGSSPSSSAVIFLDKAYTDPATNTYYQYTRQSPTYTGSETVLEHFTAHNTILRPIINTGHNNSGIISCISTNVVRNYNGASSDDNGTLNILYNSQLAYGHNTTNSSATPVTSNAFGLYVLPLYMTGTISNMFDIFLANPYTGGTVTNRWGIYQQHTANNYFGGNVGIGATSPSTKLHVSLGTSGAVLSNAGFILESNTHEYITLASAANTQRGILFSNPTAVNYAGITWEDGSRGDKLQFLTSALARMTIDNSGNVGIGTTSPLSKLDVVGGSGSTRVFMEVPASGADYTYFYLKLIKLTTGSGHSETTFDGRISVYRINDISISTSADIHISQSYDSTVYFSQFLMTNGNAFQLVKVNDGTYDWAALLFDLHTTAGINSWVIDGILNNRKTAADFIPAAVSNTSTLHSSLTYSPYVLLTTETLYAHAFSGNVTGNVSGSSGSCTGNASTASTLQTARNINGVSFNGSADISIPALWSTVVTKTSTYTATTSDSIILCDSTSGAFDVDLPTASGISGRVYTIKKVDSSANAVTIDPNGTETVDGATTKDISAQWATVSIVSNGTNWFVI